MNNPASGIPPKVRLYGYYVFGVGSIVATYLAAQGIIGADEISLWSGIGVLFGFVAASNTPTSPLRDNERGDVDVVSVLAIVVLVLAALWLVGVLPR